MDTTAIMGPYPGRPGQDHPYLSVPTSYKPPPSQAKPRYISRNRQGLLKEAILLVAGLTFPMKAPRGIAITGGTILSHFCPKSAEGGSKQDINAKDHQEG